MSLLNTPELNVDPRIEASSILIGDLSLCQVRLQNDARFPWLVLLPKRAGLTELTELSEAEHANLRNDLLVAEALVRRAAEELNRPVTKLNIANLGNIVAQLHIHVIARHDQDAAWPGPVWGFGAAETFTSAQQDAVVETLKALI
ncbi:HIT domain-containing protein [Asticcacaulis sp. AND118]|uniref:HIT domain-containing protein n=1 Tax=Asticcacaulis sp. AND118 TaxID=2840468 RepID=UPI001CFF68A9|nr:HIT domain-containing protein [Asticcacaulis sp. AND118]UDF03659.1 HIT domain-containing protein [Asticcacaulis sp. AND118]